MTFTRRTRLLGALGALGALGLSACGGDGGGTGTGSEGEVVGIKIAVGAATEAYVIPWVVADEQGMFRERGVDLEEIIPAQGGTATLQTLVAGELAVGEVAFPAVVQGKAEDLPVTAVAGATRSPYPLNWYAMADGPIKSISDVDSWGISNPGSPSEALTAFILEEEGISPDSVERVSTGAGGDAIALLESGGIDVALVPPLTVADNPDRFRLIASSADYFPEFQQTVMTVLDSYLEENPEVVEAVIAGYQEAVEWIGENRDEAAQIYAESIDGDPAKTRAVVDAAVDANMWSAAVQVDALEAAAGAMEIVGVTDDVPWCDVFDLTHLPDGVSAELPVSCEG